MFDDSVRQTSETGALILLEPDPHGRDQRRLPGPEREGLIHNAVVAMGRELSPKALPRQHSTKAPASMAPAPGARMGVTA